MAVVVVLIFAGASFFFSLAETSLFSLSKWQVRQLAERHAQAGATVEKLLSKPQDVFGLGKHFCQRSGTGSSALDGLGGSLAGGANSCRLDGFAPDWL